MTRWLVTGAGGMLGRDLVTVLHEAHEDVVGLDRSALDITLAPEVDAVVTDNAPDVVVNCAAWTDVDGAEEHEAAALRVNCDGAANLARACAALSCRMIQLSTDYVFRGDARTAYGEDAPTDPLNAYGRTKLAGEQAVLTTLPHGCYVVRTAWLYGAHGHNFPCTMLRLERERATVDVVCDQTGQPTWTVDLARQILRLARSGAPPGVYHGTSRGRVTWHGLATEVFRLAGADPARVRATSSGAFQRPARRPAFSVLDHQRWTRAGIEPIRRWEASLLEALPVLRATTLQSELRRDAYHSRHASYDGSIPRSRASANVGAA